MFTVYSGSNPSDETNVIMGVVSDKTICFDVNKFDMNQKKAYDDFFTTIGLYATVNLINCPFELDISHVTKSDVVGEILTVDYAKLTQSKKTKIETAFNMFMIATTTANQ